MSYTVKKALEACGTTECRACPYGKLHTAKCIDMAMSDALAYIETLEKRLKEAQEVIPDGWLDHP